MNQSFKKYHLMNKNITAAFQVKIYVGFWGALKIDKHIALWNNNKLFTKN